MRRSKSEWYHPVRLARGLAVRPKLLVAAAVAAAAALVLPASMPGSARAAAAWIAGGTVYMMLAIALFRSCDVAGIRQRAAREDESAFVFLLVVLVAIAASFTATIGLIGAAKAAKDGLAPLYLALAGGSIVVSWTVTQIVFTLHYAHAYYQPEGTGRGHRGGLRFPEDEHPDYWDFFYFTTSIGATSQTSDVAITEKPIRRLVAFQAVISFAFNTTILALAINLAAGLV